MKSKSTKILKREEIQERYKWDLDKIYSSDDDFEKDFTELKSILPSILNYSLKISNSSNELLECLRLKDEINKKLEKLYVYSHMKRDEDNSNVKYQALAQRVEGLNVEVEEKLSFIVPEILAIPDQNIKAFLEENEELLVYGHYLEDILRSTAHVLSPEQERIVSMTGEIANTSENIFRMLMHADMKFPSIRNEEDKEIELSEGRFYQLIRSKDRKVRKDAFKTFYREYKKYANTLAAALSGVVKKDVFYSKVKNYSNSLGASLDADNIKVEVYENIINTINNSFKPMHRYMELKKKLLKVDNLHMYDIYAPVISGVKFDITYEEAVDIIKNALKPLGEEYIDIFQKGIDSRWVDVYENQNKTNGAYSWGSYDTQPYILLNYTNTLSDVSTLAHEMGHSIHSYYTRKEQPFIYSEYSLFCAEVASTTNEVLLINYLLNNTKDKNKKMYIISQYLETIRTTVYRQTMFAEFEKIIHETYEKGISLTSELFSSTWHELNSKYYGPSIKVDDEIDIEWSRIPHFYWNFYVYKYVTGYSAATSIAYSILNNEQGAVQNYIKFLKSGGSDYSLNLLNIAGVDMTNKKPLENTISIFENLLDKLEALINEK